MPSNDLTSVTIRVVGALHIMHSTRRNLQAPWANDVVQVVLGFREEARFLYLYGDSCVASQQQYTFDMIDKFRCREGEDDDIVEME